MLASLLVSAVSHLNTQERPSFGRPLLRSYLLDPNSGNSERQTLKIVDRISAASIHPDLQVEVVSGGGARSSHIANHLPLRDSLPLRGIAAAHVCIQGRCAVTVADYYIVAIRVVIGRCGNHAALACQAGATGSPIHWAHWRSGWPVPFLQPGSPHPLRWPPLEVWPLPPSPDSPVR